MRAMVVEVGPEIEQLVFEIRRRPEQDNSEAGTKLPYSFVIRPISRYKISVIATTCE
jgi:hypothetical protein